MTIDPLTIAGLRRSGAITSHEIIAAVDAYSRNPNMGAYRFSSGHCLDIAAAIAAYPEPIEAMIRPGPQEKAARLAVTTIVMAAKPTPP